MKRLGTTLIILIILYSTYYDLTIGTLPNSLTKAANSEHITSENNQLEETNKIAEPINPEENNYQEVVIEPGQTVLSIVEHLHDGPYPATIQDIIFDFKQLNNGIEPEDIQIGKTYSFPIYR